VSSREERTRERSSMRVEWFGQSAFHLSGDDTTVAIDPFGDM
jgi:L-ascorbate metabolism protein UlaG (beta-lactamase superfamily)